MADPRDRSPCPMCDRKVAHRAFAGRRHGKLRARHKCPHGLWCAQGDPLWGTHSNGNPPPKQACCSAGYEERCKARIAERLEAEHDTRE